MKIRLTCALAAAFLAALATQTHANDTIKTQKMPVSLTGCIQREAEYRRQHHSGRGGFLGFGWGLGNEYVLVNASPNPRRGSRDCGSAGGGQAYELTGHGEGDLKPFVGQRVTVLGTRKAAEVDIVSGRPTGGRQVGYDLRLFEVDVDSFRPLPPVRASRRARVSEAPRGFEPQTGEDRIAQERQRRDVNELPRTASPLPLIALFGFLSLGAALALRIVRRRI